MNRMRLVARHMLVLLAVDDTVQRLFEAVLDTVLLNGPANRAHCIESIDLTGVFRPLGDSLMIN